MGFCEVKMDVGQVHFWVFMDLDSISVHKQAKKEWGQYPANLTKQAWSIKDLLHGLQGNFSCGTRQVVSSGQDSSILPAWVASQSQNRIWFILPARGTGHNIKKNIVKKEHIEIIASKENFEPLVNKEICYLRKQLCLTLPTGHRWAMLTKTIYTGVLALAAFGLFHFQEHILL